MRKACLIGLLCAACTGPTVPEHASVAESEQKLVSIEAELFKPGTGHQTELRAKAAEFLRSPEGQQVYRDAFETASPRRRTHLLLVAQLASLTQPLAPLLPAMQTSYKHEHHLGDGDSSDDTEATNALISIQVFFDIYQRGGYDAATAESVIDSIETAGARYLGVLFASQEALTDEIRQHFLARGIDPSRFRPLTSEEYDKATQIDPGSVNLVGREAPALFQPDNDAPAPGAPRAQPTPQSILGIGTGTIGPGLGDPDCLASDWPSGGDTHEEDFDVNGWCGQAFINDTWSRFNMGNGHAGWGPSYGFDAACNLNYPLARTLVGIWTLNYAGTWTPNCDPSGPIVNWASCYATHISYLESVCGARGRYIAITNDGAFADNHTEVYPLFYFSETAMDRAADLFHEARHADAICTHTSNCPGGDKACDPTYSGDSCLGFLSGSGDGAYTYQAKWLINYLVAGQDSMINESIRSYVVGHINSVLGDHFDQDPCFRIKDLYGTPYTSCETAPFTPPPDPE